VVDDAVLVWVVHDTNPHALSPKVKTFVQAQHWFQDLTRSDGVARAKPMLLTSTVIRGARKREPRVHTHDRGYGFRACAPSKSAVADLDK